MPCEKYVVKSGDNLWDISTVKLGGGSQWPRIWRYNNRADVMKVTGRGIPNPDLIYPGQVLLIPGKCEKDGTTSKPSPTGTPTPTPPSSSTTTTTPSPQPVRPAPSPVPTPPPTSTPTPAPTTTTTPSGPLSRELPKIESPISIKYRLDDLKFPPIIQPGVMMEMRMTGDVLLMTKQAYPAIYVTQRREIETQVVQKANHEFGALVGDNRLIYDSKENKLTLRTMLVSQSKNPNLAMTAIGVQMDSQSPIPKLRFEYRLPKLEGSLPLFNYTALDVKIVIELTPLPIPPNGPSPQPVRVPEPVKRHHWWEKPLGVGLIVVGGAIVVGTLVEDFFTAGVGVADDPASFAGAAASAGTGWAMIRGAAVVLPAAAVPATVILTINMAPANSASGQVQSTR